MTGTRLLASPGGSFQALRGALTPTSQTPWSTGRGSLHCRERGLERCTSNLGRGVSTDACWEAAGSFGGLQGGRGRA